MAKKNILEEISRKMPEQCIGTDGFMFTAYGCAVFEKELDDGRFEYVALNLSSNAKLTLERRKNPITQITVGRLVRKLHNSRIAGLGRLEVSGEMLLPLSRLKMVMSELFHKILPQYGYSVRDGQIALAEQLLEAMAGRRFMIAEAAVGLGKTLVYIIVGALIKRSYINQSWSSGYFPEMSVVDWQRMPVLISTSSIALQKSAINYIEEVSKILVENGIIHTPLRVSMRKGRTNYVCEQNLRSHMPFERKPAVLGTLSRLIHCDIIDLAEVEGLTSHIKSKICVPVRCHENCPHAEKCRYLTFREDAKNTEVDFIVTNHNLLLMDAKLRAEGKSAVLPPVQMYVLDEAHQLPSAARSIYGTELSAETIPTIVADMLALNYKPLPIENRQKWREILDCIEILAKQLLLLNKELFSQNDAGCACDNLIHRICATTN